MTAKTRTRNLNLHYLHATASSRGFSLAPRELEDLVRREMETGERFTLSFDDAHRSVLELGAPVLTKLGVTATLFVPVRWIDSGGDWMTWDDLRRWRDLGMTIGSHSMSHPRMSWALYGEDAKAHAARLDDECARSKEILERRLGVECALFAYPYGEDPPIAREAVRRAGYREAFTVRDDGLWDGDPMSIPRIDAMEVRRAAAGVKTDDPVSISVIVPVRDRPDMLREVVARLEASSYPHDRYEILVVDDGSEREPATLFPNPPSNLRFVRSAERGGPFRAGQARNAGARAAKHPVLAFLDSDVVVGKDFLWAIDWVHQRTSDAVVCGYLSGYNLHERGFVHTLADVKDRDSLESLPVIPDRSREPAARECLDNVEWLGEPWKLCYTGNLSLPRALFERIGGFSDRFSGWGVEDIDLGYRLHRAGAAFVFSRFALGWHLVDPSEGAPRNPFRRDAPTRDDFAGYLKNVALLRELHPGDPEIEVFASRALADVDEICGRPSSVGIEFGGASARRAPFHRELHRLAVGGIPTEELLDRVAYATKVGATSLWLLGGEPAEHEGFFAVLRAAKSAGLAVGMQTQAHAFAVEGLATRARDAGLGHVTVVFASDAHFGEGAAREHEAGVAALRAAGIHVAGRIVVADPSELDSLRDRMKHLETEAIPIDEISCAEGVDLDRARIAFGRDVKRLEP